MSATVTDHRLTGNEPKPRGNQADSGLPTAGSFPTRDGLLALGINEEHHFRQFAKTVGRAGWLDDPRLRDEAARATDPDLVRRVMIEALAVRSAAEWEPLLAKAGVPAARVNTLKEALAHPHVAARGIVRRLDDIAGVAGPVDVLQSPFQFGDGSVGQIARPPARLGAHTREVLAEIGVGDDEITRLMTDGTVGTQRDC